MALFLSICNADDRKDTKTNLSLKSPVSKTLNPRRQQSRRILINTPIEQATDTLPVDTTKISKVFIAETKPDTATKRLPRLPISDKPKLRPRN